MPNHPCRGPVATSNLSTKRNVAATGSGSLIPVDSMIRRSKRPALLEMAEGSSQA